MNSYQALTQNRLKRRFSNNDGVSLNDRKGVVMSAYFENGQRIFYMIKDLNGEVFTAEQSLLKSEPSINKGKYGGPSRGGAAGGWLGGNNYR